MSVVYKINDHECILIEPGHPRDAKQIDETLSNMGLKITNMLSTHAHFDHMGACRILSEKYNLPMILPLGECGICKSPDTMAAVANVPTSKMILEDWELATVPGRVDRVIMFTDEYIEVSGIKIKVVHTPGHSFDNVTFITPDGVMVVGDALNTVDMVEKMKAPYMSFLIQMINSIELLKEQDFIYCVMAHKGYCTKKELPSQIEGNLKAYYQFVEDAYSVIDRPMTIDEISPLVCKKRDINGNNIHISRHMIHTLTGVLGYLAEEKRIEIITESGIVKFQKAQA